MDKPTFLDWKLPERVDFSVDDRFLQAKFPGKTLFNPATNYFESECLAYRMNWVLVWCVAFACSDGFVGNDLTYKKNFFMLLNQDKQPQKFRSYAEGIRAGVQTIAALLGLEHPREIVWDGTKRIINAKAQPFKDLKDFETAYGEGFEAKVLAVYEELCAYAKGEDVDPDPIIISPKDPPTPIPLPPDPIPEPKKPKDPNKKPWYKGIFAAVKIIVALGTPILFILGWFFPAAVPFVKPVIEVLRKILEALEPATQVVP